MTKLVAYLVGVAAMGAIAQGTVGSALHDVLWTTRERTVPGETRIVRETTTVAGETLTRTGTPGETAPARTTTTFLTVSGPTTTTTTSTSTTTSSTTSTTIYGSPSKAFLLRSSGLLD